MFDRCVLSGRGLCDEPITHPDESYRLCYVVVCDLENLVHEEAMAYCGQSSLKQNKKKNKPPLTCVYVMLVLSFRAVRLW